MGHHPLAHHGPHRADSEGEGHSRPHTPGTPNFLRPAAGPGDIEHESRYGAQRGRVDFSLPSPISPSRPKSPWGCYDPYDSTEVKHAGIARV